MVESQSTGQYGVVDLIGMAFWEVLTRLDRIERNQRVLYRMETAEMADLSEITAAVQANADAVQSAITLIQGIKAALDAAGSDPAALAELSNSLEANTQALADAVAANTPAAPPV